MPVPDAIPAQQPGMPQPGRAETALLHDLTRWREQLARDIARNNPDLRSDPIATTVNRILFSLLFHRIAEDRGLMPEGTLRTMVETFSSRRTLAALLRVTDRLYTEDPPDTLVNAGNFPDLVIDGHILLTILSSFASAERRYDFAAIPTGILSEILLRYLARTVRRSAAHQAIIVDSRDTIQSGGANVPPPPAVGYLVRCSLAAAGAGRSRREVLPIRVLDPASGSGGILLAAYQELLDHYPGGVPDPEERRQILTDSLYGLDISRHAVAVTRMLLFFRLAETMGPEKEPGDFLAFAEEVFRDLRHTIRCGNALIGPEIVRDESWMFCPARERHTLRPFSWRQEFPEIFAAGGFDVVICNPPEGALEQREWIQQYFQRHYTAYHSGVDRSAYFLEKSLALVTAGGSVSGLLRDRWLRGAAGSRLREILNMRQIEEIVDLSGIPGAGQGGESCLIRVRASPPSHAFTVTNAGPLFYENPEAFVSTHKFPVDERQLDEGGWQLRDTRIEEIIRKVSRNSTSLENFVIGQVHAGLPVPGDDPFVIDESLAREWLRHDPWCKPLLRRLVTGAGIRRYGAVKTGKYLLLIPRGWTVSRLKGAKQPWPWLKHRHPLIARHLKPFSEFLKARTMPDELWWESACDEFWREPRKKILFPVQSSRLAFLFEAGRAIGDDSTTAILSAGPYLSGILNSRLMAFVFDDTIRKTAQDRQKFSWNDLKTLPIYTPDFDRPEDHTKHERIENLVQRRIDLEKSCLAVKNELEREVLQKKIRTTERQIDSQVYGIYGLTAAEIAIIEDAVCR